MRVCAPTSTVTSFIGVLVDQEDSGNQSLVRGSFGCPDELLRSYANVRRTLATFPVFPHPMEGEKYARKTDRKSDEIRSRVASAIDPRAVPCNAGSRH